MKVVFLVGWFAGGSPLSILNYIDIFLKHGSECFVFGETKNKEIVDMYKSRPHTYVLEKESFLTQLRKADICGIYKAIRYLCKFIQEEKIDMICASGIHNIYLASLVSKMLNISSFAIIAGGDLPKAPLFYKSWCMEKIICFSNENMEALLKNGVASEKIHVISNRIKVEKQSVNEYKSDLSELKLLLISRISKDKWNSICDIVELARELKKRNIKFKLIIAGDGEKLDELKQLTEKEKEYIEIKGYVHNINDMISWAHVIFGKGRSVIEPIMNQKQAVVVGENHEYAVCKLDNLENLYYYNFSGRNIESPILRSELEDWLIQYQQRGEDPSSGLEFSKRVNELYSSDKLEDRFWTIFEQIPLKAMDVKISNRKIFWRTCSYFWWMCIFKIFIWKNK